jgi:hypothetical protein
MLYCFVCRGQYSTITLAVYGRLSEGTPDRLGRQVAATSQASAKTTPGIEFRIKEEPVRPPESPLPDGNARKMENLFGIPPLCMF